MYMHTYEQILIYISYSRRVANLFAKYLCQGLLFTSQKSVSAEIEYAYFVLANIASKNADLVKDVESEPESLNIEWLISVHIYLFTK